MLHSTHHIFEFGRGTKKKRKKLNNFFWGECVGVLVLHCILLGKYMNTTNIFDVHFPRGLGVCSPQTFWNPALISKHYLK